MDEVTKRRLAHNEAVFRAINDQVAGLEERFNNKDGAFVCECSDASCAEAVPLTLAEFERIHGSNRRFFVVPGHELPEIETILERRSGYLVVEKQILVPEVQTR